MKLISENINWNSDFVIWNSENRNCNSEIGNCNSECTPHRNNNNEYSWGISWPWIDNWWKLILGYPGL